MQGIERQYCDVCISALVAAWRALMEVSGAENLRSVKYGKGDTLGLDAIPEITIAGRLTEFDSHALFVTEECDDQTRRRWPTDADPEKQPLMFFSDPTDRSVQLKRFFEHLSREDPTTKVGCLMSQRDPVQMWVEMNEAPAEITGSVGAITCIRKGEVVFSVILNYITGSMCVAADIGVFWHQLSQFSDPLNERITLTDIVRSGKSLKFPGVRERQFSPDDCKRFVTFLGKSGYRENFADSMVLFDQPDGFLHHREPPGPPRALYLSELQEKHGPVGFIMSNGEKIGEWIHWLAFVKFARSESGGRALRAFEISLERPWTKYGMLMSTSPAYSIFCDNGGESMYLDISRLRNFKRPSQFRCMLVVVPRDNERIIHVMRQHQYREVSSSF